MNLLAGANSGSNLARLDGRGAGALAVPFVASGPLSSETRTGVSFTEYGRAHDLDQGDTQRFGRLGVDERVDVHLVTDVSLDAVHGSPPRRDVLLHDAKMVVVVSEMAARGELVGNDLGACISLGNDVGSSVLGKLKAEKAGLGAHLVESDFEPFDERAQSPDFDALRESGADGSYFEFREGISRQGASSVKAILCVSAIVHQAASFQAAGPVGACNAAGPFREANT